MKGLRGDIALTLLSHLITKPLWLITDNLIQDRLGHDTYGLISALGSLASWANVVADWSFSYHITRQVAQAPHLTVTIASQSLFPKVLLSFTAWGLFLFVGYLWGYRETSLWWLGGLLVYHVCLAGIQYFRSFFQGHQRFRTDALLGNAEKAILILLLMAFWGQLSGGLYIGLLAAGGVGGLILVGIWAVRQLGPFEWRFQLTELRSLGVQLTPYALLVLVSGFNERLNQVLIERLSSAYENGLYTGAYRWFSAATMYLWIVLPIFYARFALVGYRPTAQLWRTFLMGQLTAALPLLGITLVMLVEPRLFLIFFQHSSENELQAMATNLQILSVAATLNALFNIYSTHLTANGREGIALSIMLMASVLNVAVCMGLIPIFGAQGGAYGLLASYVFFSVGYYVVFMRWVGLPRPVGGLPWRLLGLWLGLGGGLLAIRSYAPDLPLGVWGGIGLALYGAILGAAGIIHFWRRVSRV
jgi:O-antigen/teichoic acid export membrane protein